MHCLHMMRSALGFAGDAEVGHVEHEHGVLLCVDGHAAAVGGARVDSLAEEHARLAGQRLPVGRAVAVPTPPPCQPRAPCHAITIPHGTVQQTAVALHLQSPYCTPVSSNSASPLHLLVKCTCWQWLPALPEAQSALSEDLSRRFKGAVFHHDMCLFVACNFGEMARNVNLHPWVACSRSG